MIGLTHEDSSQESEARAEAGAAAHTLQSGIEAGVGGETQEEVNSVLRPKVGRFDVQDWTPRYREMQAAWDEKKDLLPDDVVAIVRRFVLTDAIVSWAPVTTTIAARLFVTLLVDLSPIGVLFLAAIRADDGDGQTLRTFLHEHDS
jgi:hypothetical protein